VSCPNTCDLKSKPEEMQVIGDRCIRTWGILND
jgi:CxxC motif-containing protein